MKTVKIVCIVILLFLLFLPCKNIFAEAIFFMKGDKITVLDKQLTLDRFVGPRGIWKGTDGKFYDIEAAKHKGEELINMIVTEIVLSKDGNSIARRKSSFSIGPDFPVNPDKKTDIQQVALLQIIEDGKLMDRTKFTLSGEIIGLSFYLKGDVETFMGKEVVLDHFRDGEAIWKSKKNRYYKVSIKNTNDHAEYILLDVRP